MTPTVLIGPVGDSFDEAFMRMEHVAMHKVDHWKYVSFSEEVVWFYKAKRILDHKLSKKSLLAK